MNRRRPNSSDVTPGRWRAFSRAPGRPTPMWTIWCRRRFHGHCQFRTWLLTIGGNVLKDFGRRAARRKVMPLDDGVRDATGDPHQHAEASEAEALLAAGLKQLPRLQREVFLLRAQQGLEYEEIAAALATTPGAARVHYHHAVRRLKEIVEP